MHSPTVVRLATIATALAMGDMVFAAPDSQDATAFTGHVADAIRTELPSAITTIKETPRTIEVKNGSASLSVSLDNLSAMCARDKSGCDEAIRHFVKVVKTAALQDHAAPVDKSDIRIVARPKAYIDELSKAAKDGATNPIVGPIAGDVWFVCVVDQPRNIMSLNDERAKSIGLSRDEAISLGKKNVSAALRPLASVIKELPENGIGYLDGDFYESSRFALHDEWKPLSKKLNGNLIVAVPASDLLIYGDGSNKQHIDAMAALAAHALKKSPRPISATLFRWTKNGWEAVE